MWHLRPNEAGDWPAGSRLPACPQRLRVEATSGDLLLINTALWYHQTEIPTTAGGAGGLSLSYARDFHLRLVRAR